MIDCSGPRLCINGCGGAVLAGEYAACGEHSNGQQQGEGYRDCFNTIRCFHSSPFPSPPTLRKFGQIIFDFRETASAKMLMDPIEERAGRQTWTRFSVIPWITLMSFCGSPK